MQAPLACDTRDPRDVVAQLQCLGRRDTKPGVHFDSAVQELRFWRSAVSPEATFEAAMPKAEVTVSASVDVVGGTPPGDVAGDLSADEGTPRRQFGGHARVRSEGAGLDELRRLEDRLKHWRASTTPDGQKYFYNVSTHESLWVLPGGLCDAALRRCGAWLGDDVEVFSNSQQVWCPGYVEKVDGLSVTVAFRLPAAKPGEWSKKDLPANHKDLRGMAVCDAPVIPPREEKPGYFRNFQDTSLCTNWTAEEACVYDALFQEAVQEAVYTARGDGDAPVSSSEAAGPDPVCLTEFLLRSSLSRKALKECWQVANPDLKDTLGCMEFRACCRLIGHCQAMLRGGEASQARILRAGGAALRTFLRDKCLAVPAPATAVLWEARGRSVADDRRSSV